MKRVRFVTAAAVAWAVACAGAGASSAAVPANDTFAAATAISALPFSQTLDTTGATTDATDAEANANCGAPATEASVWYALTPSTDQTVLVDARGSNYPAGVLVVTGAPGNFDLLDCGPINLVFRATAGQTYYILAFDFITGGTNGGILQIAVTQAPPPPELHMTIDPVGHFDAQTGVATVSGTIRCSGVIQSRIYFDARLVQPVGRFTISGWGFRAIFSACDGSTQPWSMTIRAENGRFGGGRAMVSVSAFACGPVDCDEARATQLIRLRH